MWSSNRSLTVLSHTGTSSYFVVAPLSEMVQIVCTFPGEADVDYVQWMNVSEITGTHLVTEENRTAVMSLTVNEHEHGRTYTCRGSMDGDKKFVYKHFTIVARGGLLKLGTLPVTPQWELVILPNLVILHNRCDAFH